MEYYHQLANDIYENRESYNSLQYIEIFKLLKENYDFATGISCDGNGHKQTIIHCDICQTPITQMEGYGASSEGMCEICYEEVYAGDLTPLDSSDDDTTYTGTYNSSY
jgi:hypothetical protein